MACACLTLLKLWLVSAQTIAAHGASPHDDQLFLSNAAALLGGEWLGRLSDLTLAKGPGYPLWLALVQLSGVRLILAQAILYVSACAVFANAIRPIVPDAWRRGLIYLSLAYNPASWADGPATRTLREGIYSSLTILLLGLAVGAGLRLRDAPRRAAIWSAAAGLAGGWFVLTREEGIWLAPSLAIIAGGSLAAPRPLRWRSAALALGTAGVLFGGPVLAVATLNARHYGLFETCETGSSYFKTAYGALTRVKTPKGDPLVPVPRDARMALYDASPAFREIALELEGSVAGWSRSSCSAMGVCDDIAGGWFQWALRLAAARSGKYRDGPAARSWYEQVAREVDDSCRAGVLDCLPARSTLMPPWQEAYLRPLVSALGRGILFVGSLAGVDARPSPPVMVTDLDLAWAERITNEAIPKPRLRLRGTIESRAGELHAVVLDGSKAPFPATTTWSTPDKPSIPGVWTRSLQLETACLKGCHLVLFSAARKVMLIPLQGDAPVLGDPAIGWITVERREFLVPRADQATLDRRLYVLAAIASAASGATPALVLLAISSVLVRFMRAVRTRTFPTRSIVAAALLTGVITRVLILALVDVTSFPAINILYMAPAYGLVIGFVALVLVGGADAPRSDSREGLRPSAPAPAA